MTFIACREELSEREDFVERELAALVASKVFYHLGSFDDSLKFALRAGSQFNVNGTSEYIETIICTFIIIWGFILGILPSRICFAITTVFVSGIQQKLPLTFNSVPFSNISRFVCCGLSLV